MMKLQKTTNRWFNDVYGETIILEPKKTNNFFFFRKMERSSGVKGMFVLATAGVLEWLVTFLSDNGISTAKK